jgi:hypothetical protein
MVFRANSTTMYTLSMFTDPAIVPVSPGAGSYTQGTMVQLNFTDPVIIGSTKYVFTGWDIDSYTWSGSSNPLQYVTMDADHNVTAHYSTQYLVTLIPNPVVAQGVTDWMWSAATGWVQENSMWVTNNSQCEVGVEGLIPNSPDGVYVTPNAWAYLVNFTGAAASNYHTWSFPPEIWYSDPFTVTGACTANSNWAYQYLLLVSSSTNPPPNPLGTGWYNKGTNVTLTAPDYSLNFAVYRYTLDHWTVDGITTPGNPIFVIMNTNHTAVAFYKRQSFVYMLDNVANASGLQDNGKWYDDGVNYTFTAHQDIPLSNNVRYDFRFWDKPGWAWTSTSNPLTISFDPSWDGEHLRARYQTQYYLMEVSSPTVAGFLYPDSSGTGWFDAFSIQTYKALPIVTVNPTTRYVFQRWTNQLGGFDLNNNNTFTMDQPYNLTASYQLQYLATWNYAPATINLGAGWPGQTWIANGTDVWYSAPATDISTQFVFYYWVVNSITYAQGINTVHVGICTGPISGTANYANTTKIFMTPSYHSETSPAYGNTFNVTVNAANFDANRLVSGNPMDIYAFDIIVRWDPTLLDLTSVTLNLNAFFYNNTPFVAVNHINHSAGTYELAASIQGNYTGFSGTKAMWTMTFEVISDAIYPNAPGCSIYFQYGRIQDHLAADIQPEQGWYGCWYQLNTVQPVVEVRNAADHTNLVKVDKNVPQQFFSVEAVLHNGVQVEDFDVVMTFNPLYINVVSIAIGTYLQAPYTTYYAHFDNVAGYLEVWVVQDPSVPEQNGTGVLFTVQFKVVQAIYYTLIGPFTLNSVISVTTATLSTSQGTQNMPNVGVTNCNYVYNPLPGDLNYDGKVDVLDLEIISNNWGTSNFDLFGDGRCDLDDLVFVAMRFGNHL